MNTGRKAKNKEIGWLGETIACQFLKNKGFSILERNYLRKWGELDIVSCATNKIHFVEVKTISYGTKEELEAQKTNSWRPEENVTAFKIQKMSRAIETWLVDNKCDLDWQIDVVAIRVVSNERYAKVKYLPNIILD